MTHPVETAQRSPVPEFFLAGFQKCATTWLHDSLSEHPQICVPSTHMVHFFDINFHLGFEWYRRFFEPGPHETVVGDTTVTYARDELALGRMANVAPRAKIVLSVRNPIDRAASHYLHERTKGKIAFSFGEWRENYDCFNDWILPGFYAHHIERMLRFFPRERVLVFECADFKGRAGESLETLFSFLGVETGFRPTTIGKHLNTTEGRLARSRVGGGLVQRVVQRLRAVSGASHRDSDRGRVIGHHGAGAGNALSRSDRNELTDIFRDDVRRLETLIGRSFDHWLEETT